MRIARKADRLFRRREGANPFRAVAAANLFPEEKN
jgi:hypothetical protein